MQTLGLSATGSVLTQEFSSSGVSMQSMTGIDIYPDETFQYSANYHMFGTEVAWRIHAGYSLLESLEIGIEQSSQLSQGFSSTHYTFPTRCTLPVSLPLFSSMTVSLIPGSFHISTKAYGDFSWELALKSGIPNYFDIDVSYSQSSYTPEIEGIVTNSSQIQRVQTARSLVGGSLLRRLTSVTVTPKAPWAMVDFSCTVMAQLDLLNKESISVLCESFWYFFDPLGLILTLDVPLAPSNGSILYTYGASYTF